MRRLAVSNLAWPAHDEYLAFNRLKALGVAGVEVAPTRIAAWSELSSAMLAEYRAKLSDQGLCVSSLQAILYGCDTFQLLGDSLSFTDLCEHLGRVAGIAAMLGGEVLVFGAPRNRRRGDLPEVEAWSLAQDRFHRLGTIVGAEGAMIGIEPVPPFYGGDFLTTWQDVLRMVRDVAHPGIRVHLDAACVGLGGGSIGQAIESSREWLVHFHAAQPELASFSPPADNHREAATALSACQYDRWIAIEMREQADNPILAIEQAVTEVQRIYSINPSTEMSAP
jgi:D-psicose/D-tagatose/L-ribulose 3-epimerase